MALFDQEDDKTFDQNKNYLEELVGEGKKFKTIEDLARGKAEADHYITHKNKEFDELREEALKWRADSVAKARFEEYVKTHERAPKSDDDTAITPAGNVVQPSFDPSKLDEILETKFSQLEARKREEANLDRVDSQLRERFGENAKSIVRDKMNALNLSQDDLKFLAKKSPEAVINALGLNQQQDTYQAPFRSNVRSDSFKPETTLRDAKYWETMRNTNSKEYFSPKNSVLRLKDMDHPDFLKRANNL